MTGIDLIAVTPWLLFGVILSAVCIRLLRIRRAVPRRPTADRETISRPDSQGAQCPGKNPAPPRR
jgi:hypothetical protein